MIEMQINGILFHPRYRIICLKMSVNVEKCEIGAKLFNDTVYMSWHQKDFFQSALESRLERILRRGVRNIYAGFIFMYQLFFIAMIQSRILKNFMMTTSKYTWCVCCFQLQQGTQIRPRQYRLTDKLILMSCLKPE